MVCTGELRPSKWYGLRKYSHDHKCLTMWQLCWAIGLKHAWKVQKCYRSYAKKCSLIKLYHLKYTVDNCHIQCIPVLQHAWNAYDIMVNLTYCSACSHRIEMIWSRQLIGWLRQLLKCRSDTCIFQTGTRVRRDYPIYVRANLRCIFSSMYYWNKQI